MSPTVFVVDDDEALRSALVQLLEAAGLSVHSYPDGRAFLDDYVPDRPGCVLLDVAMPGMTGLDLARHLLSMRPEIPIILCSGFSSTSRGSVSRITTTSYG